MVKVDNTVWSRPYWNLYTSYGVPNMYLVSGINLSTYFYRFLFLKHYWLVIGQWLHRKFMPKRIFCHFTQSLFTSAFGCEFLITPKSHIFIDFILNHTKIYNIFTQNHKKSNKLPFTVFTFHVNSKTWNHVNVPFT